MKNIKRIALILALITLSLAFSACGQNQSKDKGTDKGTGKDEAKTDWAYIQDKGKLVVGLDDTFAPMGFRDEKNEIVGFDIDVAKAVGEELGVSVEFKPIDWDAKLGELSAKNIDCVWNGMSWTEKRAETMNLSKKYMNNKIILMAKDPSINIKDAAELAAYNIGTQVDSAALDGMKGNASYDKFKDKIKEYGDYAAAYLDLQAGRVDILAIDKVMGEYTYPDLTPSDYVFADDFYVVGFRKGDDELTAKVNEALQKVLDSGKGKEISQKWFRTDDALIVQD